MVVLSSVVIVMSMQFIEASSYYLLHHPMYHALSLMSWIMLRVWDLPKYKLHMGHITVSIKNGACKKQ